MAITSINGAVPLPLPAGTQGGRTPPDPATLAVASAVDKGNSVAQPDTPEAIIAAENADRTRDKQGRNAEPDANQIKTAVDKLNEFVKASSSSNLQFSVDEESGIRVIKVVDPETKEVIRQMPTKEVVEIAKAIGKLQGLLIKQTA